MREGKGKERESPTRLIKNSKRSHAACVTKNRCVHRLKLCLARAREHGWCWQKKADYDDVVTTAIEVNGC